MAHTGDLRTSTFFAQARLVIIASILTPGLLGLLAVPSFAIGPGVERIGPLTGAASPEVKQAVEEKGYRVTLNDNSTADLWFARALAATNKDVAAGALYPDLTNGEFVGVIDFPKGTSDFRGQAIPAGTYTLRYQYIPQDANHMGVSPNPDFLLAVPLASDASPSANMPFKRLVTLSAKAAGTAHPAVFAMAAAVAPGSISKDDEGMTILTIEVPTASGKTEKLGIVLKGQATQ
jgi:hypothetical protein